MDPTRFIDTIPIIGIFLVFAVVALGIFEVGYRLGRWWQHRTPDHKEGPTVMLVGSLLALLGFLLAVTMGMASDRFDNRRALVLSEANAIGTTYLRAGYLTEPYSANARTWLREYVPTRINTADRDLFVRNQARSTELLDLLWTDAEKLVREQPNSESVALYIETLNDTIDLENARTVAIVYARVPDTVLLVLFFGEILTMGVVGYSAGLQGNRGILTAVVLVVVLGAILTLLVDLDRPRDGFLMVSQTPLEDLFEAISP
jgi:hypothetical protein